MVSFGEYTIKISPSFIRPRGHFLPWQTCMNQPLAHLIACSLDTTAIQYFRLDICFYSLDAIWICLVKVSGSSLMIPSATIITQNQLIHHLTSMVTDISSQSSVSLRRWYPYIVAQKKYVRSSNSSFSIRCIISISAAGQPFGLRV